MGPVVEELPGWVIWSGALGWIAFCAVVSALTMEMLNRGLRKVDRDLAEAHWTQRAVARSAVLQHLVTPLYLVPMGLAEPPTPTKIESLKEERARAQAELVALRSAREELLGRMDDVRVEMVRSCNDQGALYGSVSQRDISDALIEAGFGVDVRSVRLPTAIRRVGTYDVPIQFDKELRTEITVVVEPDHPLEEAAEEAPEEQETRRERPEHIVPPEVTAY